MKLNVVLKNVFKKSEKLKLNTRKFVMLLIFGSSKNDYLLSLSVVALKTLWQILKYYFNFFQKLNPSGKSS